MKNVISKDVIILTKTQKNLFLDSLPEKIYKTERNISIIVMLTQVLMIILFLSKQSVSFENRRGLYFFFLYIFLLLSTIIALVAYRYTYYNKKKSAFIWTRRVYASVLCIWVVGITYLEQLNGRGATTYCYLFPTMAALLLLTPLESMIIFGTSWMVIVCMFLNSEFAVFGNIMNSIFVTIVTLFISIRYYHSMAIEFRDRQTISSQYQKIEGNNDLLQKMAHIDQLTRLYNRHYLIEKLYPLFDEAKRKECYGMFMMLDIDYFKQYNDLYGHIQGDECIKSISNEIIQLSMLYGLTAIRYGGEEFLIIKLSDQIFDASGFAEVLLHSIWDLKLMRDDTEMKQVSVSIGLWSDSLVRVSHIESAIKHADTALYEAKHAGRNCIVVNNEGID